MSPEAENFRNFSSLFTLNEVLCGYWNLPLHSTKQCEIRFSISVYGRHVAKIIRKLPHYRLYDFTHGTLILASDKQEYTYVRESSLPACLMQKYDIFCKTK
jgi:hypothetical protein